MQSMETWDPQRTAAWLCEIGLDEKYSDICRKEDISGRALLLLAFKDVDQLLSVFKLKKGPEAILMEQLEPHLEIFRRDKPQTARKTTEVIKGWTCEDFCCWLRELGIPQKYLAVVEEEEINGRAFLSLRKSGKLKKCLQLKVGSWIVLEHELLLHEEEKSESAVDQPQNPMPTREMGESKEPLAPDDPITENIPGAPPRSTLSKEEEKLLLLTSTLELDIEDSKNSKERNECQVRSVFVKRGKGANTLESLFNFIVITKDELPAHNARKLWTKIMEKTTDWIKLLSKKDLETLQWNKDSELFVYKPKNEEVSLRDGKVTQIFLNKLSDDEYKKTSFVVLIDKQLLENKKKTYRFSFDRNNKKSYDIKLKRESKYHAAFDVNNPKQDLKWSKHFNTLTCTNSDLFKEDLTPAQSRDQNPLTRDIPQTPRPFNTECGNQYYTQGFVLDCWESGPKDMIRPVHECKIFRTGVGSSEGHMVNKYVYETLRFACACLNERTNGTIHFGVADEVETQACGYKPREIIGSEVTNKPLYNDKLTEFIEKCFVGASRSIVHYCIRPPVFIPVRGSDTEQQPSDKVVIEVDIEPTYSLCEGEVFKACLEDLPCGKKDRKATAYLRRGSRTQAVEGGQMEEYLHTLRPKLDEERKVREQALHIEKQSVENQGCTKHLFGKLQRLLCANKKVLDSSIYPILVLNKPDGSMNQDALNKTFSFLQNIKWLTVIDFDDQGSDSDGLCKVFKSGPESPQVDIHEAEDYDGDDSDVENIYYKTHWIFGNGYVKLGKDAVGFKQWNNSKRKRGLSKVIQSLAKTTPGARAVVLFLLLSEDYQPMADTFKEFCTYLDGPNQLVYVAENPDIVTGWEEVLSKTCLEEHELRERGVVGMSWTEFQECVQQMVSGIDREQKYVTMATGTPYPLGNVSFNCIDVVSAKECEELCKLNPVERSKLSSKVEVDFYRGYPVTWMNFWFTDAQKNHVLRRDNYSLLKSLIEKLHFCGSERKVHIITVYHHIGAGASTMTRQALWDFRHNPDFPYRCAVVTKIDDSTCKELLHLRKIGYGEDHKGSFPPVLALVEDTDDFLFRELLSQLVEHASKLPRANLPVCVFLFCKPTQNPKKDSHQEKTHQEETKSVFLEQHLSEKEVEWFKDKYTEIQQKFNNEDPKRDFQMYANENLISFMIMKENYNPKYASKIVAGNLDLVTGDESTLLKYTSLLSIYNPVPVFASCFDTLMLSSGLLRRKIFRDWVEDLTHSARIFLREEDCSTHSGTGKAIAIVHPIIARELLDQIVAKEKTTVSEVTLEFLKSPLLQSEPKSFTATHLHDGANRMLKNRKKYEYGDDVQTKFSPLIEKILYVNDKEKTTEQSIHEAANVLRKGFDIFKDPMLAQQMARVFYVNAEAFSKSTINACFDEAFKYCRMAMEMNPNNSFLCDTMGRIHEAKMKLSFDLVLDGKHVIEIQQVTKVLPVAFEAMKWFKQSFEVAVDYQNKCGCRGELCVMFYLLRVLRHTELFWGEEGLTKLQGYLAYKQAIPPEVEEPWRNFHEPIKRLQNRFSDCMEGLAEEFTVYKGNVDENILPIQIAKFKAKYHSYFGKNDLKWSPETPREHWEYRWEQINQYIAGDIFSTVFRIHRIKTPLETPEKTLHLLRELADKNYCEPVDTNRYKDLLLLITTNMALHSPYGNRSNNIPTQLGQEYRDIYKLVEQLFALEERDERHRRLYAHVLKVMFLWPRSDLELRGYRVQEFYDALRKLNTRWESRRKLHVDAEKILAQKMYKYMSFKKETRQYTTLFYLGKGTGLDAFVHINELAQSRGPLDWENPKTKFRLKRLTGIVESRNIIKVKNPIDPSRMIDVYYSSYREGGFSKEEVSFYLGFSWPRPIALDVKYTKTDHLKHSVECKDQLFDDNPQPSLANFDVDMYEQYTSRAKKLTKTLEEINSLKDKKDRGEKMEDNQVTFYVSDTLTTHLFED